LQILSRPALPYYQDAPAHGFEFPNQHLIPADIAADLSSPERDIGCGQMPAFARVPVPKTTVNEDHCPIFAQDDIGFARNFRDMGTEAKP
jgi:hypothetical protein